MAFELKQQLKLSQPLIMTPQLQMAIKLLQQNRLELMETISQELEDNPALEEVQETSQDEQKTPETETSSDDIAQKTEEVTIEEKLSNDVDWSNYLDEYNSPGRASFELEKRETPNFESFIVKKESLNDHLLWQLLMLNPTPKEEEIGSRIIGNLNRDGYLESTVEDLAKGCDTSPEEIERLLLSMQTFDPIGVCARNLKECLLTQSIHFNLDSPLITEIIENHLSHLENKNYKAISKILKVSFDDIVAAVQIIRSLEPKPGRQYSDEEPQYIQPDIYVYKYGNDFVITLNDDGMPKLRLNSYYRNAMDGYSKISGSTKDYLQDKMRSAAWLIKSIHQRQRTIYKVMESILSFQREFFEKGISHLKPMVLRDVAENIGMHESTISRVTTNKYAHTPQGIFELKYFFNSSIGRTNGEDMASVSVMDKIRLIIENENAKKPFSDDKISKLLKEESINIARRTVAKYREMLGILSSNKRRQI
ncbi:MAG: RNA polymerase factor sigma-54 [Deltaproteobacteria bacterium]|nr:RNA polymerase factor sigma-54 [Deltaproteobacteria bacterium]